MYLDILQNLNFTCNLFRYANKDRGGSYHLARGNANNVVGGRFGAREPGTDEIKETIYTAGPRGYV